MIAHLLFANLFQTITLLSRGPYERKHDDDEQCRNAIEQICGQVRKPDGGQYHEAKDHRFADHSLTMIGVGPVLLLLQPVFLSHPILRELHVILLYGHFHVFSAVHGSPPNLRIRFYQFRFFPI